MLVLGRLIIVFLCCFPSFAVSAVFEATGARFEDRVKAVYAKQVEPYLNKLPPQIHERVTDLSIIVDPALRPDAIAYSLQGAINDRQSKIIISDRFLVDLSFYVEAFLVAEHEPKQNFLSKYLDQYYSEVFRSNQYTEPLTPEEFASNFSGDIEQLIKETEALVDEVILDILLHEIGHHATQSFYSYRAADIEKKANEVIAEKWAEGFKLTHYGTVGSLGRLLPVALIIQREHWIKSAGISYPIGVGHWLADHVNYLCEEPDSERASRLCQAIDQHTNRFSGGAVTFGVDLLLVTQSNFVEVCGYFNESLYHDQVSRAVAYVAWCYQKGFIDRTPLPVKVLAMNVYRDKPVS